MKLSKKLVTLLVILMLMFAFAGCGGSSTEPSKEAENSQAQNETITVTDHAGNVVEVPSQIDRIAVCSMYPLPSVLAIFFDSAEKIVAMPEPSMIAAENSLLSELYPEILKANTEFSDGDSVNVEELMKLEPDIVFYNAGSTQVGQQLRDAGFAAVGISAGKWDYDAIETLNQWIAALSEIFPGNDRVALTEEYSNQVLSEVQERVGGLSDEERARIFFLFQYNDTTITTSGNHFFGQWWADAIGAVNVGEEMETDNSTPVNMEQIYTWNPEHILITNFNAALPDDLYNNSIGSHDWSEIDAVKNHKIDKMPLGMYRSYTCGVDTPVTLWWMAKTVYPELFEDVDITEKTKEYYKTVFDIELTDEQAEQIFTPPAAASAF